MSDNVDVDRRNRVMAKIHENFTSKAKAVARARVLKAEGKDIHVIYSPDDFAEEQHAPWYVEEGACMIRTWEKEIKF